MKRAVSISLGSSTRDKRVEVDFKGEHVIVERIGTDGDIEKAIQLYNELDGQVDALDGRQTGASAAEAQVAEPGTVRSLP